MKHTLSTYAEKSALVDLASHQLTYEFHGDVSQLSDEKKAYLTNEYKRTVLDRMYPNELLDVICLRPTVVLEHSEINTELRLRRTEVRPLSNLMFVRDQQIVTPRGVIQCRLNSTQREAELHIMRGLFDSAGIPVIGAIEGNGRLEGGDFFMVDAETALVSVGLRSNYEAVYQLMEKNLVGARRVVIVDDSVDLDQQRMHLDTIFNIVSTSPRRVAVMLDAVMAGGRLPQRTVVEYVRDDVSATYRRVDDTMGMEFSTYLKEKLNFDVVPVTEQQQADYLINFINMGRNRIVSVHPDLHALLRSHGVDDIDVKYVEFDQCTSMFGAARCCSQVFRAPNAGMWRADDRAEPIARAVVMSRPDDFGFNEETAADNAYQHKLTAADLVDSDGDAVESSTVRALAAAEFSRVVQQLRAARIDVLVLEPPTADDEPEAFAARPTPDAVFPNNWFATTATGDVWLFPMATRSRIAERRPAALSMLLQSAGFDVRRVRRCGAVQRPVDVEFEMANSFEGTGAAVIDKQHNCIFAALSNRCSLPTLQRFAMEMAHDYVAFETRGSNGQPVYHTNVVMAIGSDFAVVCFDAMVNADEAQRVRAALGRHDIIEISLEQMEQHFCANVLELQNKDGQKHLVMSKSAWDGFTSQQRGRLSAHAEPIVCEIPTIERCGGGSIRCMMAEVFLPQSTQETVAAARQRRQSQPDVDEHGEEGRR